MDRPDVTELLHAAKDKTLGMTFEHITLGQRVLLALARPPNTSPPKSNTGPPKRLW